MGELKTEHSLSFTNQDTSKQAEFKIDMTVFSSEEVTLHAFGTSIPPLSTNMVFEKAVFVVDHVSKPATFNGLVKISSILLKLNSSVMPQVRIIDFSRELQAKKASLFTQLGSLHFDLHMSASARLTFTDENNF